MSSHHFVKEGQEAALLLCDRFSDAEVESLLQWAPVVACLPPAIDSVIAGGIKIDAVIVNDGDYDEARLRLAYQLPVDIISVPGGDLFDAGISYMITRSQQHVNALVPSAEGYFEQARTYLGTIGISLVTRDTRWSAIRSRRYRKWLAAGSIARIRSAGPVEIMNGVLDRNDFTIRVLFDGLLEVRADDTFWIGETFQ